MSKPKKVFAIYEELAEMTDGEISNEELMRLSSLIVNSYTDTTLDLPRTSFRLGREPREFWPLDELFRSQNSWMLSQKSDWLSPAYDDDWDSIDFDGHLRIIENFNSWS